MLADATESAISRPCFRFCATRLIARAVACWFVQAVSRSRSSNNSRSQLRPGLRSATNSNPCNGQALTSTQRAIRIAAVRHVPVSEGSNAFKEFLEAGKRRPAGDTARRRPPSRAAIVALHIEGAASRRPVIDTSATMRVAPSPFTLVSKAFRDFNVAMWRVGSLRRTRP
jgi:hypothetical protein